MTEGSTITNVGTEPNVIATVDGTAVETGKEKAIGNYLVTTANGTLKIESEEGNDHSKGASKNNDGTALTESGFKAEGLAEGDSHQFTVAMTEGSTITNVGTEPNVIATVDGTAVTTGKEKAVGNYLVTTVDGTLTINPKKVTITAEGASKEYDGTALTESGFNSKRSGKAITHEFTVAMTEDSTITNVGTQPNVIATVDGVAVETGTEKTIGNYLVTTADGTLTINPKKVTITAATHEWPYDGTAHTDGTFTASALEEGDDHTFTVVMTEGSTITDVGTQPNVIATVDGVAVTTGTETAVGNYLVTTANGELKITKDTKALVITSATTEWTYDSKLHKDETYTVTYGGEPVTAGEDGKTFTLTNGDVITITATAAGVTTVSDNADENNTYTYTVKNGTTDTTGNYASITANKGTLTINPKKVTITAKDASKPYDGTALTESRLHSKRT